MIKYFAALFVVMVFCFGLYLFAYVCCNLFVDFLAKWREYGKK